MDEIETKFKLVTAFGIAHVGYNSDAMMGSEKQTYYVAYDNKPPETFEMDLDLGDYIPIGVFNDILIKDEFILNGVIVPDDMLFSFNSYMKNEKYNVHRMNK